MFKEQYLGIVYNIGDSLCSKIVEMHNDPKKHCQVLHRSVVLPQDPNKAFEMKILLYPNSQQFLTVIEDNAPSNI